MYFFNDNVEACKHDEFVMGSPQGNLLQSYRWSKIKQNWSHALIGAFDESKQIAACLVLIKHLPLGFTMMYIPRGPIFDYDNSKLTHFFFSELKLWAKKRKCLFIKIDPPVLRGCYKELESPVFEEESLAVLDSLSNGGLRHLGFTKGMSATIQPRYNMVCHVDEFGENYLSKKGKKNYKIAAKNKHLSTILTDKSGLDDFAEVMCCTAERQGVALRDREYYELLLDVYGKDAFLTLTYLDIKGELDDAQEARLKCIEELKNCPQSAPKKRFKLEENLTSYTRRVDEGRRFMEKYGEKRCIAGTLTVICGKSAELLYAGADNAFRRLMAPYRTWFFSMQTCFDRGCEYVNMGGISGFIDDGLQEFKHSFSPYVHEYLGEFDLPVSKLLYRPSRWLFDKRKGI